MKRGWGKLAASIAVALVAGAVLVAPARASEQVGPIQYISPANGSTVYTVTPAIFLYTCRSYENSQGDAISGGNYWLALSENSDIGPDGTLAHLSPRVGGRPLPSRPLGDGLCRVDVPAGTFWVTTYNWQVYNFDCDFPSCRRTGSVWWFRVELPDPAAEVPNTLLTKRPKKRTRERRATFKFKSDIPGATFECHLGRRWRSCKSPLTVRRAPGRHAFVVRAIHPDGTPDPTPAIHSWMVRRKR